MVESLGTNMRNVSTQRTAFGMSPTEMETILKVKPVLYPGSASTYTPVSFGKRAWFCCLWPTAKEPSNGLVVMEGDSGSEGHGFESRCCILDGHDIFSH